jgi:MoxR-like ATPase
LTIRSEPTTELGTTASAVLDEMEKAMVGKRQALSLVLVGVLAGGHVLLEDVPGTGKTSIARSLARVLGLELSRIQFTPDLMPADVTGSSVYDQARSQLVFEPGPIFANLVLGDEINRAPPKTQAALLEAMQERQVTADGVSRPLPVPFTVIATQNPIEYEGTYPLPEAQLDRFMLRTAVGYPSAEEEWEIIWRRTARSTEEVELSQVIDRETLRRLMAAVEEIAVDESVGRYLVEVTRATRTAPGVEIGASPRAGLSLLQASRALAGLRGRGFVVPDDVKTMAVPCLSHRLTLRPDLWLRGARPEDVVRQCLNQVPVPVDPE